MEQWRIDYNAALGAAKAAQAAGDYNAAINYANTAAAASGTSKTATVAVDLRQAIYTQAGPGYGPGASLGTGGGGGTGGGDTGGGSGVTGGNGGSVVAPPPAFSALEIMENFFKAAMGLSGIGSWAADLYNRGASPNEIVRALRYGTDTSAGGQAAREAYLKAFPGMEQIIKEGIFPGESPELQYIQYRNTVKDAAARYGVADSLVAGDKISQMILGRNSAVEIADRMNTAATAIATTPQETYAVLENYYGVGARDLMSFYLDTGPTEAELKKRYTAARIGTEAVRQRFGIDRGLAEDLVTRGVTVDEANVGFGKAYDQSGFMVGKGDSISQEGLVNAQFGVAQSAAEVARIAAGRKNAFAGGGEFAAGKSGVAGLASADM